MCSNFLLYRKIGYNGSPPWCSHLRAKMGSGTVDYKGSETDGVTRTKYKREGEYLVLLSR